MSEKKMRDSRFWGSKNVIFEGVTVRGADILERGAQVQIIISTNMRARAFRHSLYCSHTCACAAVALKV